MNLKEELKYNKDHSWVLIKGDVATIGAMQESIDKAGEVVFVNPPREEDELRLGDSYTDLESLKTSISLSSPVSGKVIDVNNKIFDEPSLLNDDSYSNFICKVKYDELGELMSFKKAKKYYEEKLK